MLQQDIVRFVEGWTFDGQTGECVNIPQVIGGNAVSGRTSATALPCVERQGMLWICPTPGADVSPAAIAVLPELDEPGWTSDDFVRDMPVDFTLLLENVADPDHGVFAHQTATFDSFTASAAHPMAVSTAPGPGGDKILGRVAGVLKMTGKNEAEKKKAMRGEAGSGEEVTATLEFAPPVHVRWARFDASGRTTFITAFWASPAGLGRTRFFLRYARSIAPWFHPPRWLFHILINGFLDQDTYLLATQQEVTLAAELGAARANLGSGPGGAEEPGEHAPIMDRRRLFCHRSPTDNFLIAMGRWLDAAVPRVPNRYRLLVSADAAGALAVGAARREDVLDRLACQTALCPESAAAYSRFKAARLVLGVAAALGAAALVAGAAVGLDRAALIRWAAAAAAAAAGALVAHKLARQFEYVYTRDRQAADLKRIPKFVPDK
ncbi:hypothetical protein WJX81_004064 [Elliptochloris bilobata]|uniref:Pheophorbide a oxygenase domain-containing protein n=1 Tax=Elliptochloris bilobata TaxID=381761 RepID=A0AAW1RWZ3_9CHLO